LARPDVPVFPQAAVDHLDLRLPFLGVADSHRAAESLLDADPVAVRPDDPDMVDAILEGLRDRRVVAAGKSAAREPRLADAVPDHPGSAWAEFPERLAWSVLEKR
jgi:hypothetical protein